MFRPLYLVLMMLPMAATAQVVRCFTHEATVARDHAFAGYAEAANSTYQQAINHAAQRDVLDSTTVYHIPVVVHVVYHTAEENIDQMLILGQIDELNRDYRRWNPDAWQTRPEFLPVAADARIEFYLAGVDPDGNPTGGITRTYTDSLNFPVGLSGQGIDNVKQSALGGADAWDTDRYLNIWVCNNNDPQSPFGQLLGYAYPPIGAPNWPGGSGAPQPEFEGVVIFYKVFGPSNPLAVGDLTVADRGRACVHEVGHYLGLRHTWGDGGFDGCTVDDGLTDTPNCSHNAFQECDQTANTCVDAPIDFPDMIENYMDYADEDCMNLFTQQQVGVMRSMLETVRNPLISSGIPATGIQMLSSTPQLLVYPNPATDLIHMQCGHAMQLLLVFDAQGRCLATYRPELNHITLNLSHLAAGSYLIRAVTAQGAGQVRVVRVGE